MTVKDECVVHQQVRRRWSEAVPWLWTAVVLALVTVTAVATIGALCEILYGSLWHALILTTPFLVLTTVVSRWSQRRPPRDRQADYC